MGKHKCIVIFQNNTFAEIWSQADRNWKYSKTYYQVHTYNI